MRLGKPVTAEKDTVTG